MLRRLIIFIIIGFVLIIVSMSYALSKTSDPLIDRLINTELSDIVKNDLVIACVKSSNKMPPKSLEEMVQLEKQWRSSEPDNPLIKKVLNNPCSDYLRKVQKTDKRLYLELFIMDKQGSIIAGSNKTSDYWQGDEAKFVEAFADGKGSIFIDKLDFDVSTNSFQVQISLPVIDPATKEAIGTMTVGIKTKALDTHKIRKQ
jgi:hypothetical protein